MGYVYPRQGPRARLLMVATVVVLATSCASERHPPTAIDGSLDFSGWDFEKDGAVKLSGEWAIYPDQFVDPTMVSSMPADHGERIVVPFVKMENELK